MKKKLLCNYLIGGFLFITLSGCFYFINPMRQAEKALNKGDCEQARKIFLSTPKKKLVFAKKAGDFCLSKSPQSTVWFYHYLSEREEKEKAYLLREKIANIYFEILKDYEKAIETYSILKKQSISKEKKDFYVYRMALSFFELGKFPATLSALSKQGGYPVPATGQAPFSYKNHWDKKFLIARTFLMQKKYTDAERIFQEIQYSNPLYFKENELFHYLSFIYELQKEFHQAISELEQFENTSEFLANKIRRLKIRQKNQPGVLDYIKR